MFILANAVASKHLKKKTVNEDKLKKQPSCRTRSCKVTKPDEGFPSQQRAVNQKTLYVMTTV